MEAATPEPDSSPGPEVAERRCLAASTVSRAVAAVFLIRSRTWHLGEVEGTRVAGAWPTREAMVALMARTAAAAAKDAEGAARATWTGKGEEGIGLSAAVRAEAKPEEAGTPPATSPADSTLQKIARTGTWGCVDLKMPEAVETASPAAAAAVDEAAVVSAAAETTRKPSAGVTPTAAAAAHSAPAALPRGMRPDARSTP